MKHSLECSYFKGGKSPELLTQTIGDLFDQVAGRFPGREALLVRHQGIRWTWSEFQVEVEKLASGLLALGLGPGDRVGIWAPNCSEWCLIEQCR